MFAFPPEDTCGVCSARPLIRAIVMAPFADALRSGALPRGLHPDQLQAITVMINEHPEDPKSRPVPYIRMSLSYACPQHRADLERVLAKAPSWAIVEINAGPDPTNKVVFGYEGAS